MTKREIVYELVRWAVLITVIALAFVGLLCLWLPL